MISPTLRPYRIGDEYRLWEVFYSAVHEAAKAYYSRAQLEAWAPREYPGSRWADCIARNQPIVAVFEGEIVGYADLQRDGHIDHFFVAGPAAGRGVGRALMEAVESKARELNIGLLTADVSLAAEPFFCRFGFVREREQEVIVRGIALRNIRMLKVLRESHWVRSMD